MDSGVDLPSSAILFLLRVDRAKLVVSEDSVVTHARRRFSGVGLPWIHLETDEIGIRLNGVVALADGPRARELARICADLSRRWPVLAGTRPRMLAELSLRTPADLEAVEYYSGAVELLDRLMTFALSRPGAAAREIAACERWLHGRFTQYLTGRGALRNVVLPWRTWLERYEYLLRTIEGGLDEVELPDEGPLLDLSRGLTLLTTRRDRNTIVQEYRNRLTDLSDACNRVSAEIGVIGTFGSLALVPFESALGFLFLVPVVVAGSAYYGGHSLARSTLRRSRKRRREVLDTVPDRKARPALGDLLPELLTNPVHVVATPRLAAADIGCALEIRHLLIERTTCPDPLSAVTIGAGGGNGEFRVVVGGPLVRGSLDPFVAPECDLTDSRGNGWEIVAGGRRVVHCDDDETVGCCVAGPDGKTLFLFGVRDAGTVVVTRWLAQALDDTPLAGDAGWVALRRGNRDQPIEVARG